MYTWNACNLLLQTYIFRLIEAIERKHFSYSTHLNVAACYSTECVCVCTVHIQYAKNNAHELFRRAQHCSRLLCWPLHRNDYSSENLRYLPNQFTLRKYRATSSKVWACDDNESSICLCSQCECVCFGSHLFRYWFMLDKIFEQICRLIELIIGIFAYELTKCFYRCFERLD